MGARLLNHHKATSSFERRRDKPHQLMQWSRLFAGLQRNRVMSVIFEEHFKRKYVSPEIILKVTFALFYSGRDVRTNLLYFVTPSSGGTST